MSLPSTISDAVNAAWAASAELLSAVTLRTSPVVTYDAGADTASKAWTSTATTALFYGDKIEEKDPGKDAEGTAPAPIRTAKLVFRGSDIASVTVDNTAEIDRAGEIWRVLSVERPPGNYIATVSVYQ